jgi:hypothetical protein
MTIEQFNEIQATIPDGQLIEKARALISELAKTGGISWSLRVPPDPENDPDMVFGEIARRLEQNGGLSPTVYFLANYTDCPVHVCATDQENPRQTKWYVRTGQDFRLSKKTGYFHFFTRYSVFDEDLPDFHFDTVKEAADCYNSFHGPKQESE